MAKSLVATRIRAEVIRLVALIPKGRFTTYGSIAVHMNVTPRQVARVLSHLTDEEAKALPWHRVVAADARISRGMDPELADRQRARLKREGMKVDARGFIVDADEHFHVIGIRRDIRWDKD
jgi:methylated-DNA-protein-cysteine methyltransferase-like protein